MFKLLRSKKGAALAEYSLLVAGIMLVGAAGVSVFGLSGLLSSVLMAEGSCRGGSTIRRIGRIGNQSCGVSGAGLR